jgi:hypothetical protein
MLWEQLSASTSTPGPASTPAAEAAEAPKEPALQS